MNVEETPRVVATATAVAVLAVTLVTSSSKAHRRQGMAFLAAWLVPGAGHFVLARWRKGLFFFVVLALTYATGLWLSGWRTVSFDDNPFYHVGQYGCALTTLLGWVWGDPKAFPRDDVPKSWFDPGLLYVCVVGLLNVVIMLSVLEPSAPLAKEGDSTAPKPETKS